MIKLRLAHYYLGVFFAPLILFFAFSGVLQVFKLHEAYREVPGRQGDWIAWFASFHKEQAWIEPKAAPAKAPRPDAVPHEEKSAATQPLKWLVAAMGVALMVTTCLGLYIAFRYPRRRTGFAVALGAGIAVPLLLMAF